MAEGARRGRPPRLTRETVARAVLEVGFPQLTFTAVRERLGVGESTLFRYAPDRDELVRLGLGLAMESVEMPPRQGPWRQVLTDYARAHPDRPDWVEILSLYRERFAASLTGPVPGMEALLDELLEEGVALYGLTNFDAEPFEAARLLVPQLERFVGVVVSGREHLTKPDPAAFELLLSRYRLQAPSTLFIDDSPVNIEAAGRLGLRTHRFTGSGRLRSELIALGLLPTPGRR